MVKQENLPASAVSPVLVLVENLTTLGRRLQNVRAVTVDQPANSMARLAMNTAKSRSIFQWRDH